MTKDRDNLFYQRMKNCYKFILFYYSLCIDYELNKIKDIKYRKSYNSN